MKTLLTLPAATQLLAKEFARKRAPECRTCTLPTPFWGPAPEDKAGLWYLRTLEPCVHGCHKVVAQIWAEITTLHAIEHAPLPRQANRTRERKVHSRR